MKICFYIDVKIRDLPIAKYLAKKVKKSYVLPIFKSSLVKGVTYKAQRKYSPDIVITTSFNKGRTQDIAFRAAESSSVLVEFTSEQYFSDVFNSEKLLPWNINDRYKVDYYFCWGKSYAQKLISVANVPNDRIFIIGSPKLISTAVDIAEQSCDTSNNVLLVSDYLLADFDHERLHEWNKEYDLSVPYEEIEVIKKERRSAIETANQLCQRGLNVTVRLHPGESPILYQEHLLPSVQLSLGVTPFNQDLESADLVIGYTTTAIFEIVSLKKRFVSLRNHRALTVNYREFYKDVEKFTTEQLLNLTNRELKEIGLGLGKTLEYHSANLLTKFNVDVAFVEACRFILNKQNANHVRDQSFPLHISMRFKCISHLNVIVRSIVINLSSYSLLPKWVKRKAINMTNTAHNMNQQDYDDFYSTLNDDELLSDEFNFTLSNVGWVYRGTSD